MGESSVIPMGGQPRYLLLAERIAEDIQGGAYPVGSKLPTETELCELFDASRFTVREAIKQLQSLGMVTTRHGTGTQVLAARPTRGRFQYSFDSVSEFLHSARETRLSNIQVEDVTADRRIASAMQCEVGQPLLRIRTTRVLLTPKGRNGRAISLAEVHVLAAYDGIREDLADTRSTISGLVEKRYGVRTARIEQTLEPCAVTADEARALGVQTGSLGLRFQRQYVSTRGEVFEHVTSVQAGDEASLRMSIRSRDAR